MDDPALRTRKKNSCENLWHTVKLLVPRFSYELLVQETWTVCHQHNNCNGNPYAKNKCNEVDAKFDVCIFTSSVVPEVLGDHKIWKVGHVTRPLLTIFQFFSIHQGQSACKIWGLYFHPFQRYYRGVPNMISTSRDLGYVPLWPFFFWISTSWSPAELQFSTWLDLLFRTYGRYNILAWKCLFGLIFGGFFRFDP